MATNNIKPATELDFDNIKRDIIEHFKNNTTFSDYNFEGSALNTIIDILAYSTHTNAYYANMIHNESFIDTAQKRSSVVSIAKELGYIPASTVCSTAYVDVTVTGVTGNLYLNKGKSFGAYNENGSFTFIVADTVEGTFTGNTVTFSNVKIVNGFLASSTFTVDSLSNVRGLYTIPNKNVDTSTLNVYLKESAGSLTKTQYSKSTNVYESISTSTVYFLQESYDNYYQIYFGDNVLGVKPSDGNVITIDYVVAQVGAAADGCRTFSPDFSFTGSTGVSVVTKQNSFGSKSQETIDSIRINAVKNNSAKNRAVTEDDYRTILLNKFPYVKNCIIWGGERNIPPVYGKVFISIQPVTGYVITEATKNDIIIPEIRKSSLLTTVPEIVDPDYMSVEFSTTVKFNRYNTTRTESEISLLVKNTIKTYMDDLSSFGLSYYQSNLITQLVNLDKGIISVSMKKLFGFNITPLVAVDTQFERLIHNEIMENTIVSDRFDCYANGKNYYDCVIKELDAAGVSKTNRSLGIYSNTTSTFISTIGTVNLVSGLMKFHLNVTKYLDKKNFIGIRCVLVDEDIKTANNQILVIDSTVNTSLSTADNYVLIENINR